ncbi:ABC transporter substrate-binding protein [Taklimakanibacter lacteus]|uniref:ABC transporter substrate-binding protein n=1 Tax=Taklimakanibacter lacteus TaxID=2268456 RepID=UPI000E66D859
MSDSVFNSRLSRRGLLGLGALLASTSLAGHKALALSPAERYVTTVGTNVLRVANSGAGKAAMRQRLSNLINQNANVRSVGLVALGPYRKNLPPGKAGEFVKLVSFYMAAFFVYYIDEFQGSKIEIDSSSKQGNATLVNSLVRFKNGSTTQVRWRILGAGQVGDINVRGVWLSLQLKKRFTDVLKRSKGDFDALFAELKSAESW